MVIAQIYVDGISAKVTDLQKIPKGIAGAVIRVQYAPNWDGLSKTAVFAGAVTRDVLNADGDIVVPAETVERSGYRLRVGFYGVDGENKVIIPTLWADLGIVQDAADPSGDPGADPGLPVWAHLQQEVEELKNSGGLKGDPGFSPIAKVTQTENGAVISITDEDGTTTATVTNGAPGADYQLTPEDKTEIAEMAAGLVEVPEATMKPLTFKGAVNATYDGSEAVEVEIPQGGGGGESKKWVHIAQIDITEDTNKIYITEDVDGNPFEVENIHVFIKAVKRTDELSAVRVMKLIYNENGTINENSSLLTGALVQQNSFGNKSSDKYYYYESVVIGNYRKLNAVESNATFANAMTAAAPSVYEDGTTINTIKNNAIVDGVIIAAVNGFKVGDTIDIWGI